MSYVGVGTAGIPINISAGFDISAENGTMTLEIRRPDGVKLTKAVTIDSGPAGTAHYTLADGDISTDGTYSARAKWVSVGGAIVWCEPVTFTVSDF